MKGHTAFDKYDIGGEVTALAFSTDGLWVAIGSEWGKVRMFDLWYPLPLYELQHQYWKPIKTIKFHPASKTLWTSDEKTIKVFEEPTGNHFTSIQPKSKLNDFEICHESGLVLTATEEARLGAYFLPSIGQAPKWIPFLDSLTEELE